MRLTRSPHAADAGSTASIGLAVASAVMAGGIVLAQAWMSAPPPMDPRTALYDVDAATALKVMVRDDGLTTTGLSWETDPDHISRFGLALDGQPNFIDYTKIKALRKGTLTDAPTNLAPDYPEVRRAIGITDRDIHLRTYPVMPGVGDPRWVKEQTGRVAYMAHYASPSVPVTLTPAVATTADALNVTLVVRNDGTVSGIFSASISLGDSAKKRDIVTEQRHTTLLAPGASQTLWVRFDKVSDWDEDINAVHYVVTDPYSNVALNSAGVTIGEGWMAATPVEASGNGVYGRLVHAGNAYEVTGSPVTVWVKSYDGDGKGVNNHQARLELWNPDGTQRLNQSISIPNNGYKYECTTCTAVGTYTAVVWDSAVKLRQVDQVHVSATQLFTESLALDAIAASEMSVIATLTDNFRPTRYSEATNAEGDLFGDESNGPNEMADVLSRYATVIIGSEVKQTALTSAETKRTIADWVQAGGNLIVLGTKKQVSEWLEPIYSAAQINANGGISAPDPTHPVLVSPDRLDYSRYLDRGRAWDIDKDQPFTHVLSRGSSGNSMHDTLTVSAPGAIGDGTVVLTSYMPGSLTDPQDPLEAKKFLHNLMSQAYTMLFLDYGPPIPDGVPVGSAQRLVAVPHPNVPGAVVEVKLVMYVFG